MKLIPFVNRNPITGKRIRKLGMSGQKREATELWKGAELI
jgi:hypothetical protein